MGRTLLVKLVGIGVTIAILAVGGFLWNKGRERVEESKAPKVGECVNLTGSSLSADHEDVGCDDAAATYEVVGDDGRCDEEAEINYTISLGSGDSGNVADLCLALNAAEGDCFDLGGVSTPASKIACTEATSTDVRVASVGKAGDQCASPHQPLANPTRGTLLCLGAAA